MKFFKTCILSLAVIVYFCAFNVLAQNQDQFPDPLRLQPMPPDIYPNTPGNINKNEQNFRNNILILQQISQYEFDLSRLDANTSYIDTINHRLFVADTANNRVFVFNLNADNVLIDNIPDNVLGQPNFTASDPGTTQSNLYGPTGIAYDLENEKLFVADTNNNRIMIFDVFSISNGENAVNVLGQPNFTASDPGTTQSGLDSPFSLDYDSVNHILFVTDVNNNRVVTFNMDSTANGENAVNVLGQPNFTASEPGKTQSKLDAPAGLAYDSKNGNLFVADTNNNRVMVFSAISISNGEDAVDVILPNENSAMMMSPPIIARMKEKPKSSAGVPQKKPAPFSFWPVLLWLIVFLAIAALVIIVFSYAAKKKKSFERK